MRKYQTNPAYKKQVDDERRARKKAEASIYILCASSEWVASVTQERIDVVHVQSVLLRQIACLTFVIASMLCVVLINMCMRQ